MARIQPKVDAAARVAWWKRPWLLALLLVVITATAYLPALRAGFIWDDDDYVTRNVTLRTAEGLRDIWFKVGATYQYYPLVHTTFWLEYQLWQLDPFGFHLVNVLLHSLSAVLLWRVLVRIERMGRPAANFSLQPSAFSLQSWSWLAAAIFALHPVMVESVAWITERKNVLSAVCYFGAALVYLRFLENREGRDQKAERLGRGEKTFNSDESRADIQHSTFNAKGWYFLALALFVCALLSKTVTCSLPAALLLVLWWRNGGLRWRDVLPTLPFFAVGLALGLFTAWVEKHHVGAFGADWNLTLFDRCLIAGRAVWFYAAKLFWPSNLTFIYPRWEISAGVWWQWLFPVAAVGVVATLFLLRNKIGRGPLVAVLFFGGTLLPALGFINTYPMRYSFVADHFQYLASVGLIVLAAAAIDKSTKIQAPSSRETSSSKHQTALALKFGYWSFSGAWRLMLGALVLGILGVLTWKQTHIYHNLETLWRDTIAKNPACWMAHNNLGEVLRAQGGLDDADDCYRTALRYKPDYPEAINNLGYGCYERGQYEQAAEYYHRAIQIEPGFAPAWSNLGAVLVSQGETDSAIETLRRALQLDGNNMDAMNNLAVALTAAKQYAEAIGLCQTVIQLQPDRADARINLGNIFTSMGRVDEAIASFTTAAKLDPKSVKAHTDLAGALAARGRTAEAIAHYTQAVRLSPTNATLHYNLGVLFAASGRTPEAVEQFRRALKINPDYAEANNNLGVALTLGGSINEALKLFETAIRSKPDYAEAHNNLAYALIKLGRRDEAVVHLREALRINPDYRQAKDQLRDLDTNVQ